MLLISCFFETTILAPVIDGQLFFSIRCDSAMLMVIFFNDIILKLIKNLGGGVG